MKSNKKGLSLAMALMMFASIGTGAFAQSAVQIMETTAAVEQTIMAPKYLQGEAVVKSVNENGQVLVMVNEMEVALNTSAETFVIDAKTGLPGDLKSLKAGDLLYVYYSPAMTRSLPAQSFATAIITNVEKDKTRPSFFTVKEVVSKTDKEVRVLNEEGDLIATISKDMPISPFKTKQIVTFQDIKVGTQLFIWYDIVAMSYPGQTQSQKTVIVGQAADSSSSETPELGVKPVLVPKGSKMTEKIMINGKAIALGKLKWQNRNGHVMVPLRLTAESLGFTVTWDKSTKGILLDDGTVKTVVTLGQDGYYKASSKAIGLTQSFKFGAAPVTIGKNVYVPVELFNLLYSDNGAVTLVK